MDLYWYWPFARSEELDWARATARPGDRITVQVLDRDLAPPAGSDDLLTVVRDLPDVTRARTGAVWVASRARTYLRRERRRRARWSSGSFDLVHLHYLNRFTDAWAPLPHPLVISVHDVVPHQLRLGTSAEHRLVDRVYRRADALVVHHLRLADRLMADHGVAASKVHVVPHQVFPVGRPVGSPASPPTVLFFGALRPNKGIELLDAATPHLRPDLRVTVAGRGDPSVEATVRSMAARHPTVAARVELVSLEAKRALFEAASIVVLPYTAFASQSGVLHDAYGHGRPVVVTDVGALGDTVREDGTGLVVAPNDPVALARAVGELLEPERWRACSAAALRIAEDRSPAATGLRQREVYDLLT